MPPKDDVSGPPQKSNELIPFKWPIFQAVSSHLFQTSIILGSLQPLVTIPA